MQYSSSKKENFNFWHVHTLRSVFVNSHPPKPEVILANFFAEPTVLLVPITSREVRIRISSISYDFWNELDRNAPKGANFQIWMFIFFIQLTCSWLMLVLMSYLWVNKANDLFYFEKRTQIPKCHIFGRHVCSFYFASNFDVFFPSFNLLSWDLAVICRRIFYTSYGQEDKLDQKMPNSKIWTVLFFIMLWSFFFFSFLYVWLFGFLLLCCCLFFFLAKCSS